jgi:hypothetical protein
MSQHLVVWGPKWIQIKKLSTIEFFNFSRSTIFILVVSPSEAVYKIWISNGRNSKAVFYDKMILNKKLSTTKFHNFLRSITFVFVCPFEIV